MKDEFDITIDALGSSGEGVGHLADGYTVFIDGALPQEKVTAKYIQRQKRYARAELITVVESSDRRVTPKCPLYGRCGGCQLMHLEYSEQLKVKQQRVIDALKRIGKIADPNVLPCIASPSPLGYRNKIQLPTRQKGNQLSLGLYAKSSHDLVDVDTCPIHCSLGDAVYAQVKTLIQSSKLSAYDPITGKGELRHLLIKSGVNTEQVLVILVTKSASTNITRPLALKIMEKCPNVKGVVQNVNPRKDNTILGRDYEVLCGSGHIQEKLADLYFKVSPASFFQVNPAQAVRLYEQALAFAKLKGDETVLDAYCGVGTLALFFANKAKKVIGVECVKEAIVDAKENASYNGIDNVSFVCAEAENYISNLRSIDVAILNPPRKGCDPKMIAQLNRLTPKKIVYISCDPGTLARDLALLIEGGYQLDAVQPFDMFPQTAHVECVVSLNFIS